MLIVAAEAGGNNPYLIPIIVAIIASIPGILAGWYSFAKRKDDRQATATEFGTEMAKTAFITLQAQVTTLLGEQEKWARDREEWQKDREVWEYDRDLWKADKTNLIAKINVLTEQLTLMNAYLGMFVQLLDHHGIPQPSPPYGYRPWSHPDSESPKA